MDKTLLLIGGAVAAALLVGQRQTTADDAPKDQYPAGYEQPVYTKPPISSIMPIPPSGGVAPTPVFAPTPIFDKPTTNIVKEVLSNPLNISPDAWASLPALVRDSIMRGSSTAIYSAYGEYQTWTGYLNEALAGRATPQYNPSYMPESSRQNVIASYQDYLGRLRTDWGFV